MREITIYSIGIAGGCSSPDSDPGRVVDGSGYTVIVNWTGILLFPDLSTAIHSTTVFPISKNEPGWGVHVTRGFGSCKSLAKGTTIDYPIPFAGAYT